ncbi:MAG: molybdopterin-guanine dinucleotide biosynthesis protein A [Proteobacteria bacterium]|nr:molybdopterin-guanine dinucleotide biosynthesis protein A [Pseudomonadota bacterium]
MAITKWLAAAIVLASFLAPSAASAGDRHAGYYYPEPASTETYKARARTLVGADRTQRIAFITGVTLKQRERPHPPIMAMFAKGEKAQKLIIVGLEDGRLNTIYRARAILAMLTATARATPIFREYQVEEIFTFLDLCKMLGFSQVTISDGKDFAHQILIE